MDHQSQAHNQFLNQALIIEQNVPLANKNWFGTGGSAAYFSQPQNAEQMRQAIKYARDKKIPIFMLGQGANILISDNGFDGMVIRPQSIPISAQPYDSQHSLVTAGAGTTIDTLIEWALDNNLLGLEEFSGIPGTVGGSVYINLHYYQFLLGQFLVHAQVIDRKTGEIYNVDNNWFNFGYDKSTLQSENHYLISATFKLRNASATDIAYAQGRRVEIIRHRKARYPYFNTCGSFFKNFAPEEVSLESNGKKLIWVAYYLDKLGIKGELCVGDAIVSHQHANMLVNRGNATSTDLIQLARTMQKMVYEQFGIIPQPECRLLGFTPWPLLK